MPRGCPNPDAAWKFIEHATSVEASFTLFNIAGSYPSYKPFLEKADFSAHPGLQWFVNSAAAADEIYFYPQLPLSSDEVDDRINSGLDEMSFGTISGQEMLTRIQGEVQTLIDQAVAAQ
jgi:ABC-type glycerol-3-phosphate transport system substrate-binding protein